MPKKRHNPLFTKPVDTPHHTLLSSPRSSQNDRLRSSSSSTQPSVNDLIHHLRRTQVSSSDDRTTNPSGIVAPRSVHPSLRNLLELPETPPPRPRPNARRVGVGRLRRAPGPPPPESWLLGNNQDTSNELEQDDANTAGETERIIYRLERLPGTTFPPKNGLLHMSLKAMTQHWAWHVAYDGQFLAMLPTHVKVLLLSYIAVYGRDQPLRGLVRGLKPLIVVDESDEDYQGAELDNISRLDIGGALGRWMGLKELNNELFFSQRPGAVDLPRKSKDVPASWEEEYEEDEASSIPKTLDQGCRFENLRFLSLAHPHPSAANWKLLLKLLSRLSTLTHLSLAHWPVPTLTPNAINARVRHPTHRSLTFSYGGTDTYSAMENNWAEAAGVLRKLSHATYCLKWLDLEGCGDWIPALSWTGHGPDGEVYRTGPEWNGAWRDIEWIRLGPGWLPHIDDAEIIGLHTLDAGRPPSTTTTMTRLQQQQQLYQPPAFRSLASSIHAPPTPPPSLSRIRGIETDDDDSGSDTSWDVEVERVKYRRAKELERYRETMRSARMVQQQVQQLRREGRGKWVHFSFGIEELKEDVVRELLGEEYMGFLP